ncbi:hypothetical protein GY45DRAFT_1349834 [Cubamyces sp. BRFM 1775]|nr:hypothetical protein GY45DRAFT_1349834 [Cubamyces sp. BRFM 1775]
MYLRLTECFYIRNVYLDLPNYYAVHVRKYFHRPRFSVVDLEGELGNLFAPPLDPTNGREQIELNAISARETPADQLHALQRNDATPRNIKRLILELIIIVVNLAHQLNIKAFELTKALPVHLAVQGSRTKVNYGCRAAIEYQRIRTNCYFDIVNLLNYDLILGTPFLFQHKVIFSFNPTTVVIRSTQALPIEAKSVRTLQSHSAEILEDRLEDVRCELSSDSPLPPLCAINHRIPLIDEDKVYSWRPSKCPDALRALWIEKPTRPRCFS